MQLNARILPASQQRHGAVGAFLRFLRHKSGADTSLLLLAAEYGRLRLLDHGGVAEDLLERLHESMRLGGRRTEVITVTRALGADLLAVVLVPALRPVSVADSALLEADARHAHFGDEGARGPLPSRLILDGVLQIPRRLALDCSRQLRLLLLLLTIHLEEAARLKGRRVGNAAGDDPVHLLQRLTGHRRGEDKVRVWFIPLLGAIRR